MGRIANGFRPLIRAAFLVSFGSLVFAAAAPAATFEAKPATLGSIPDGTATISGSFGAARSVEFDVSGFDSGSPTSVAVSMTLDHPYAGDLDVVLRAPDGTQKTIFSRTGATTVGGFGDQTLLDGTYRFSDKAPASPTWWGASGTQASTGSPIPSDSYRISAPGGSGGGGAPATDLTFAFFSIPNMNGTWKLLIKDGYQGDTGSITGASLELNGRTSAVAASLGDIPDGGSATYGDPRNVQFQISDLPGRGIPSSGLSLSMTLTHSFVGDLDAVLIAPGGQEATVFSRTGATAAAAAGDDSDLGGQYEFFDSALGSWWSAAATAGPNAVIPAGNYKPTTPGGSPSGGTATTFGSLLTGVTDPNGTWTLRLCDHADADEGSISASSMKILAGTDSTAPSAPGLTGFDPPSPGNSSSPALLGTAEAGSFVRVYDNGSCSGLPVATGGAAKLGGSGITVPAGGADGTFGFAATAYDTSGNVSGCSPVVNYVKDTVAPAGPSLTETTPASPANDNSPKLKGGGSEAGATIQIFEGATCTGPAVASGPLATYTGAGLTVSVDDDSTTTFSANAVDDAGNESGCSQPLDYVEDSTAPEAPTLSSTDPASPANGTIADVLGSAEPGTTVRIYGGSCVEPAAYVRTAAELASGIEIEFPANQTTTLRATATDAAGNVSACSAPLTYTEDSIAPAAPTISSTDPASPANGTHPKVKGSAEAGSTVRLYGGSGCTGSPIGSGPAATFGAAGITLGVPANQTTSIRAAATDAAGNVSACSAPLSYTEDSIAPDTTAKAKKAKVKTRSRKAKVKFTLGSEAGATLACGLDGKAMKPCGTAVTFTVKPGKHVLLAVATDAVGNQDATPARAKVKVVRKK